MMDEIRYTSRTVGEELPDGTVVYVAEHPELPGCMAQGASPASAWEELADARALYIQGLLKRGLEVPAPASEATGYQKLDLGEFRAVPSHGRPVNPLIPFALA